MDYIWTFRRDSSYTKWPGNRLKVEVYIVVCSEGDERPHNFSSSIVSPRLFVYLKTWHIESWEQAKTTITGKDSRSLSSEFLYVNKQFVKEKKILHLNNTSFRGHGHNSHRLSCLTPATVEFWLRCEVLSPISSCSEWSKLTAITKDRYQLSLESHHKPYGSTIYLQWSPLAIRFSASVNDLICRDDSRFPWGKFCFLYCKRHGLFVVENIP